MVVGNGEAPSTGFCSSLLDLHITCSFCADSDFEMTVPHWPLAGPVYRPHVLLQTSVLNIASAAEQVASL